LKQIAPSEWTAFEETDGMPTPSYTEQIHTAPQLDADGLYWITGDGFGEALPVHFVMLSRNLTQSCWASIVLTKQAA
jgi:hypothetical protein